MQNIIEVEQIVLGSVLDNPKLIHHIQNLSPNVFSNYTHSELWRILLSWHLQKKTIYPPTLLPFIEHLFSTADKTAEASAFLTVLLSKSFPLRQKDLEDYEALLVQSHLSRETLHLLKTYEKAIQSGEDVLPLLSNLQNDLFSLRTASKSGSHVESIGKVSDDALRALEQRINGTAPKGMSTGFKAIDRACGGGLHKGGLVMIGGATGMGKTIMGIGLFRTAINQGKRCLYFNLEMKREDMIDRFIAGQSMINNLKIREGALNNSQHDEYRLTVEELQSVDASIISKPNISIDDILMIIREQNHSRPVDVVIVDYIQIVRTTAKHDRRDQELSEMTVNLSNLAKELNISIVVLAQLNEDVSKRENNRPTLSDIRESKSMGHSCENVWLLHREEYYHDKKKPSETQAKEFLSWEENADKIKGKAEIIMAKNRHGYPTSVLVKFEGQYSRFTEAQEF